MEVQIGKVFKALLKEKRATLQEISNATGVSTSTLHEWQNNRKPKDPAQVAKVAEFFGVTLFFFLFGKEDSNEPLSKVLKEDMFHGTFEISIKRVRIK